MKRSQLGPGTKSLERGSTFAAERKPLKRNTELRASTSSSSPRPRRRAVSPASPAQRAKVKAGWCIVTGESGEGVDPAHLWPRGRGGCDDPDCVVPLRRDHHRAFDQRELDLLPYLIAAGCWKEIAHMVEVHHVDPIALVERLTGRRVVIDPP